MRHPKTQEDPLDAAAWNWDAAIAALRAEGQRAEERFRKAGLEESNWDAYDAAADYLEFVRETAIAVPRGDGGRLVMAAVVDAAEEVEHLLICTVFPAAELGKVAKFVAALDAYRAARHDEDAGDA